MRPNKQHTDVSIPHQWKPFIHQLPFFEAMDAGYKRAVMVWHRRAGKDSASLNFTAMQAFQRKGVYWHMLPTATQARKVVWDGIDKKGRRVIDQVFPPFLREGVNKQEMKIELRNGSIWQCVGSDNYDSLVGSNPVGVVFSEYSLADPTAWDYIRPILAENGGWAIFIYTPRGKNHGFTLYDMAKKNPTWYCQKLTVDDTAVVSNAVIEEERAAGMTEAMISQEFYCNFDIPVVGAYFAEQINRAYKDQRICRVPIEPSLPVYTFWDLGIADSMSIWFAQPFGQEIRLIHYYENNNEGMAHYINYLKDFQKDHDIRYEYHYAPHDIKVRELMSGKSRLDTAKEMGIHFRIVKKHSIMDGIEAVRQLFSRFWIDEIRCGTGINAISSYCKEYDEKNQVYRDRPKHDWACFPAGTKVKTKFGEKPIEYVYVGDTVQIDGWEGRVYDSGYVKHADTIILQFNDGTELECTPEHKIFTTRGLLVAIDIDYNDEVLTEEGIGQWSLNGKGILEVFTENTSELNTVIGKKESYIAARQVESKLSYIEKFGKKLTAQYRKVTQLCRSVMIGKTLALATGNVGQEQKTESHTNPFIHTKNLKVKSITELKEGTTNTQGQTNIFTGTFGNTITAKFQKITTFIMLTIAKTITTWKICNACLPANTLNYMQKITNGSVANKTSDNLSKLERKPFSGTSHQRVLNGIENMPIGLKKVVSCSVGRKNVPVYNLSIDRHHAYIANGILVSNSHAADSLRQLAMSWSNAFGKSKNKQPAIMAATFDPWK